MKKLFIMSSLAITSVANSTVIFYGGDFDGRATIVSGTVFGDDGVCYDDFTLTSPVIISGFFGNYFQENGAVAATADWEIRTGMSANNPGTLLVAGNGAVTSVATGRFSGTRPELQLTVSGVNSALNPGTYFMSLTPNYQSGTRLSMGTTSGADLGPGGDPNPAVTGSPIANGNSFYTSASFPLTAEPTETLFGAGTWDFSYGVLGVVPEPGTFIVIGVGLAFLALGRRK